LKERDTQVSFCLFCILNKPKLSHCWPFQHTAGVRANK